jgi:hypothetical protein
MRYKYVAFGPLTEGITTRLFNQTLYCHRLLYLPHLRRRLFRYSTVIQAIRAFASLKMKFASTVATAGLLATTLAMPLEEKMQQRRHERLAKRLASRRGNTARPLAPNASSMTDFISAGNVSEVTYSSNWAGAVIESSGVTSVTGTFNVPTVKMPSGGSSNTEYGASAWVGIDGNECGSGMYHPQYAAQQSSNMT